jgi:WD40 repeat protein
VNSVCFSPDEKYLLSASADKSMIIWDLKNGDLVTKLINHNSSVNSAEFSPCGKFVLSGSDDNSIIIWSKKQENVKIDLIKMI